MRNRDGFALPQLGITLGYIAGVILLAFIVFRVGFVNFVDNYELAYKYEALNNGMITILRDSVIDPTTKQPRYRTGYVVSKPFADKIHTIDLRPMQVCINANSRVLNCKLVKFNADGIELFLSWHGRNDYTQLALNPILMSYAYDGTGKSYPFLDVLRELKPEEAAKAPVQP